MVARSRMMALAALALSLAHVMPVHANPDSLRVIVQGRPDMAHMHEVLEMRLGLCRLAELGLGKQPSDVKFPTDAELTKLVTHQKESLIDGDWEAEFSFTAAVHPDINAGCQFRVGYKRTATVVHRCVFQSGGSKEFPDINVPGPQTSQASFSLEKEDDPGRCIALKSAKPKALSYGEFVIKGATPGGHACVWVGGSPGNLKAPDVPGPHFCVHPRVMTGKKGALVDSPVVWAVNVPAPNEKTNFYKLTADINRGNLEAVLVEEGKPIAKSRFTEAAVKAFVEQPNWLPLGGKP
jgi:hypothetical protein